MSLKYRLCSLLLIFIGLVTPMNSYAFEDYTESINQYHVLIEVNKKGGAIVTESFLYDFKNNERHGIIRNIPVTYYDDDFDEVNIPFEFISVTNENNEPYNYYLQENYYDELRIGDPDILVTGEKWYVLKYEIGSIINGFDDYDELYYNSIGNMWDVPISNVTTTVILPEKINQKTFKARCFTGYVGSQDSDCNFKVISPRKIEYSVPNKLLPYNGFTVVAGFDKGMVTLPSIITIETDPFHFIPIKIEGDNFYDATYAPESYRLDPGKYKIWVDDWDYKKNLQVYDLMAGETTDITIQLTRSFFGNILYLYFPISVFLIVVAVVFLLWWFKGKEYSINYPIIAEYDPPDDLSAGEIGVIYDQKVDLRDITASIVQLAIRGNIKIVREGKKKFLWGEDYDFKFVKLKGLQSGSLEYEKKIFTALFGESRKEIKISDLQKKFYKSLPKVKKSLYAEVVKNGYFKKDPDKIRKSYKIIGNVLLIIMIIAGIILGSLFESMWYVYLFPLSGVIAIVFSYWMPRRTRQGAIVYKKIMGLELFMEKTVKERLSMMQDPKDFEELFNKLLPYAIVLKVENKWAKHFKKLYDIEPNWLEGEALSGSMQILTAMELLDKVISPVYMSRPTSTSSGYTTSSYSGWSGGSSSWSGGSGFSGGYSGGGFGGGGGSSW